MKIHLLILLAAVLGITATVKYSQSNRILTQSNLNQCYEVNGRTAIFMISGVTEDTIDFVSSYDLKNHKVSNDEKFLTYMHKTECLNYYMMYRITELRNTVYSLYDDLDKLKNKGKKPEPKRAK